MGIVTGDTVTLEQSSGIKKYQGYVIGCNNEHFNDGTWTPSSSVTGIGVSIDNSVLSVWNTNTGTSDESETFTWTSSKLSGCTKTFTVVAKGKEEDTIQITVVNSSSSCATLYSIRLFVGPPGYPAPNTDEFTLEAGQSNTLTLPKLQSGWYYYFGYYTVTSDYVTVTVSPNSLSESGTFTVVCICESVVPTFTFDASSTNGAGDFIIYWDDNISSSEQKQKTGNYVAILRWSGGANWNGTVSFSIQNVLSGYECISSANINTTILSGNMTYDISSNVSGSCSLLVSCSVTQKNTCNTLPGGFTSHVSTGLIEVTVKDSTGKTVFNGKSIKYGISKG